MAESGPKNPVDQWAKQIILIQQETGTPDARILGLKSLILDAPIPQTQISKIKIGDIVDLEIDGAGKRQGRVSKIATSANQATRTFNVEILEPQSLILSYDSYEWDLSSSLKIDFSLYLSNGAPRPILVNIYNELEPEDILYSSKLVMDNGFRLLSVNLGNPDFSNLAIEVIPLSWFNSIENSINTTSLNVIIPFADID